MTMEIEPNEQVRKARTRLANAFNMIFPVFLDHATPEIYGLALHAYDTEIGETYKIVIINTNGLPESSADLSSEPIKDLSPWTLVEVRLFSEILKSTTTARPRPVVFCRFETNSGDIDLSIFVDSQERDTASFTHTPEKLFTLEHAGYLNITAQMLERCFILVSELER